MPNDAKAYIIAREVAKITPVYKKRLKTGKFIQKIANAVKPVGAHIPINTCKRNNWKGVVILLNIIGIIKAKRLNINSLILRSLKGCIFKTK